MHINRAGEIFDSLGVIEVYFQGHPVWIEKINKNTVGVINLDTNEHLEVSAQDLIEG